MQLEWKVCTKYVVYSMQGLFFVVSKLYELFENWFEENYAFENFACLSWFIHLLGIHVPVFHDWIEAISRVCGTSERESDQSFKTATY